MTLIFCIALLQDPLDAFKVGDRVEITFTSGKSLRGTLRDKSKLVKLELEEIQGSVSFEKQTIKSIKAAPSKAAPATQPPAAPDYGKPSSKPDPGGLPVHVSPPKEDPDALARVIYAEFPESEGWGPAKYDELKKFLIPTGRPFPKYLDARIPSSPGSSLKSFAAADEREAKFFENYALWLTGKRVSQNK
jgi:hypothetical protein